MKIKLSESLLPCPFCGGSAHVSYAPANDEAGIPCYGITCGECKILIGTVKNGATDFFRTAVEAANAWNARDNMPVKIIAKEIENGH